MSWIATAVPSSTCPAWRCSVSPDTVGSGLPVVGCLVSGLLLRSVLKGVDLKCVDVLDDRRC